MIALQKFEPSDYATLINWVDSPELLMQFAGPAYTFPLNDQQLQNEAANTNKYIFKIVDKDSKITIGHAEIQVTESSCYLSRILIGEPQMRGKGLGKMIMHELLNYAFIKLNQDKVELNVFSWNTAAIHCYRKFGFEFNLEKKKEFSVNEKTWLAVNMFLERSRWNDTFLNH